MNSHVDQQRRMRYSCLSPFMSSKTVLIGPTRMSRVTPFGSVFSSSSRLFSCRMKTHELLLDAKKLDFFIRQLWTLAREVSWSQSSGKWWCHHARKSERRVIGHWQKGYHPQHSASGNRQCSWGHDRATNTVSVNFKIVQKTCASLDDVDTNSSWLCLKLGNRNLDYILSLIVWFHCSCVRHKYGCVNLRVEIDRFHENFWNS